MSRRCATLLAILAAAFFALPATAAKKEHPKLLPPDGFSRDDEDRDILVCTLEAWESVENGLSSPSTEALGRLRGRSSRGFLDFSTLAKPNRHPGVGAVPTIEREGRHPVGSGKAWSGTSREQNISDRYVLCLLAMGFRWSDDAKPPARPSPSFESAASSRPDSLAARDPLVSEGIAACRAGDHATALGRFVAAAEKGDAEGQFLAGINLSHPKREVDRSVASGIEWLRKAADQGNADALFHLALDYDGGHGVDEDPITATRLGTAAALRGHPDAQSWLSFRYRYGYGAGVPIDYVEAVGWQRLAAGQGHLYGLENLAYHYQRGLGVKRDRTEACRLFGLGAEKGNVACQTRFAYCLSDTENASHDFVLALAWFEVLSKRFPPESETDGWVNQHRARIASMLSAEQIQDATTRAEEIRSRLAAIAPPDKCLDPFPYRLAE